MSHNHHSALPVYEEGKEKVRVRPNMNNQAIVAQVEEEEDVMNGMGLSRKGKGRVSEDVSTFEDLSSRSSTRSISPLPTKSGHSAHSSYSSHHSHHSRHLNPHSDSHSHSHTRNHRAMLKNRSATHESTRDSIPLDPSLSNPIASTSAIHIDHVLDHTTPELSESESVSKKARRSSKSDLSEHQSHHHRESGVESDQNLVSAASTSTSTPVSMNRTKDSKDLRNSLPQVIALLTCRSCHKLLQDPTTLPCGHSICLNCSLPISSLKPLNSTFDHQHQDLLTLTSESQFSRNPTIPLASSTSTSSIPSTSTSSILGGLLPSFSSSTAISSEPTIQQLPRSTSTSSILRGKLVCPYEECQSEKGKEKMKMVGSVEPKLDFVLQKVLEVLRKEIGGLAEEVNLYRVSKEATLPGGEEVETVVEEKEGGGSHVQPGLKSMPGGSEASLASTDGGEGGEDQPLSDEDSKRIHRSPRWTSSKKMRRKSLNSGLESHSHHHEDGTPATSTTTTRSERLEDLFDFGKNSLSLLTELQSELECQVCVQLLDNPITTPCGHTYCQKCLARSLDHSDKCPLCRSDFPSFTFFQSQPVNFTTRQLILSLFPQLFAQRKSALELEERINTDSFDTPIFVCTLAWPNLPTYIHIFEPRYRLMMRRVMESPLRQFGMVLPSRDGGGTSEYGTMLEVQSWNMIEDGRSIVETVGTYRFRLLEKETFDGYTVGRVERVDDISQEQEAELERLALARNPPPVERRRGGSLFSLSATSPPSTSTPTPTSPTSESTSTTGSSPPTGEEEGPNITDGPPPAPTIELSTQELMGICLEFIQTLRSGSAPWVLQRLNNTIGPMPTNASDFSFWMAEVMPVDDHVKSALLQITSPRERLRLLVFWIEQFKSSWWFSRGCSLM